MILLLLSSPDQQPSFFLTPCFMQGFNQMLPQVKVLWLLAILYLIARSKARAASVHRLRAQ